MNLCVNYLSITGDFDELNKFDETFSNNGDNYSFENIRPLEGKDKYDVWGCNNIKCIDDVVFDENDNEMYYTFTTPWDPCDKLVEYIGEKYSDLDFRYEYDEHSMEIAGIIEYKKGEKIIDKYSTDTLSFRNILKDDMGYDYDGICLTCKCPINDYELSEGYCPHCDSEFLYEYKDKREILKRKQY